MQGSPTSRAAAACLFTLAAAIASAQAPAPAAHAQPLPVQAHAQLVQAQRPAAPTASGASTGEAARAVVMTVVAGSGVAGFADGVGPAAQFNKPIRLAPGGPGAVLVADIFNHAIRVVSKDGRVRTITGGPDRKGHADGPAATARLASPHGVASTPDGRILVAEAEGHTLRVLSPRAGAPSDYDVRTLAGTPGKSGDLDGPADAAMFNSPHGVLVAGDGSLYVPDIGNASIRRLRAGQVATVVGKADALVYPMDIAWMKDGRMVIADAGANRLRTWQAGQPLGEIAVAGGLATPHGVAAGPDGTLYVADMKSHRVLAIDLAGKVTTVAGVQGEAGSDSRHLNRPAAVLVHADRLWIADLDNHRITSVRLTP